VTVVQRDAIIKHLILKPLSTNNMLNAAEPFAVVVGVNTQSSIRPQALPVILVIVWSIIEAALVQTVVFWKVCGVVYVPYRWNHSAIIQCNLIT